MNDFRLVLALLWFVVGFPLGFVPNPTHLIRTAGVVSFIAVHVIGLPLFYYIKVKAAGRALPFICAGIIVGFIPSASLFALDQGLGSDSPYAILLGMGLAAGLVAGASIAFLFRQRSGTR